MNADEMVEAYTRDELEDQYNERFGVNLFMRPRGYMYVLSREPSDMEIALALESGEELPISGSFC